MVSKPKECKMRRSGFLVLSGVMLLHSALFSVQRVEAQALDTFLENIHASIVQMLGDQDSIVDVSISGRGRVLTVSRVNGNLNFAAHDARGDEALQIAVVASRELAANSALKNVRIIRVLYISRLPDRRDRIIDTVEFRNDPTGVVEFHAT